MSLAFIGNVKGKVSRKIFDESIASCQNLSDFSVVKPSVKPKWVQLIYTDIIILQKMACIICFDLSKIMELLKSTKRPAGKSLKYLETCSELKTCKSLLEHVEIDCGFEIWHIKPFCNSHILKGAIF